MFGAKKKPGWMAVSLHGERIDLVYVRHSSTGRPEIVSLESFKIEESIDAALARLRKEFKLSQYRCATLLPPGEYQIQQVDAPNVPDAEVREAVRWRIKDLLDYSVQAATIDVLNIPLNGAAPGRPKSIFAVSANNAVVGQRMDLFDGAKIPLEVIDIPELAQRNIATLFEEGNRGLVFLAFDEYGGTLTFTQGGELYASRRIEITLNQLVEADSRNRELYLERIGLELQRSLDNCYRQFSLISLGQVLLLPVPNFPELEKYLSANLDVPVKAIDLADVIDFSGAPELKSSARQAQCLHTIGLALRAEGVAA